MAHPDAALLRQARAALEWWESLNHGPTSSITGRGAFAYLEACFSEQVNGRPCLALPSGTAALISALIGVGVTAGTQVICSAYDWSAATGAVRTLGAIPIYADLDPDTVTIAPTALPRLIGPCTSAVIATHPYGIPADIAAIRNIADRYDIPVIEDAAQALASTLDTHPVGTLAAAAAFSFGPGKPIDAGEGGLACFAHQSDYDRALQATQHPVRQLLNGVDPQTPVHDARMAPMSAILAAHQLHGATQPNSQTALGNDLTSTLQALGITALGRDARRQIASGSVLAVLPDRALVDALLAASISISRPGAHWWPQTEAPTWISHLRLLNVGTIESAGDSAPTARHLWPGPMTA